MGQCGEIGGGQPIEDGLRHQPAERQPGAQFVAQQGGRNIEQGNVEGLVAPFERAGNFYRCLQAAAGAFDHDQFGQVKNHRPAVPGVKVAEGIGANQQYPA